MSKTSSDITSLFKHLGTSSEHYQEIGRSNEARESEARWPLLASIHESAMAAPAVVPAVASATSSVQPARDLVKTSAKASVAPLAEAASRSEPSIALPALLHDAPTAEPRAASTQAQATAAPTRKAEFIAPRPKSLVTIASRREAPPVHKASASDVNASKPVGTTPPALPPAHAPLPPHDASQNGTQIENMFARLAKRKTSPVADQPTAPFAPAPNAPEPKRSLFERLIRK